MVSPTKKIKLESEDGDSVFNIKQNPSYQKPTVEYSNIEFISLDKVKELFNKAHDSKKNIYEFLALTLAHNTRVAYKNLNEVIRKQLVEFLIQHYFVVYWYKENSLPILKQIYKILCGKNHDVHEEHLDDDDLLQYLQNTPVAVDTLEDVYDTVTSIANLTHKLHFPGDVSFTKLGEPLSKEKGSMIRVEFNEIVSAYDMKYVEMKQANGTKTKVPIRYMTEFIKAFEENSDGAFRNALNNYLIYECDDGTELSIVNKLWMGVDFSSFDEYNVHNSINTIFSRNYVKLSNVVIYERTPNCQNFNVKSYPISMGIVFSYDKNLHDSYCKFEQTVLPKVKK